MTDTKTSAGDEHPTLTGRLTESLLSRRLGFFFAELVLVVAGILIALAIDGWVSDARDRRAEVVYLELLARDIDDIRQQANRQIDFEKDKVDTGAIVYAALTTPDPRVHEAKIGSMLAVLGGRRTLSLSSATYSEMVSSGQLRLIRNRELRDSIVRYVAQMELNERIAEKNNRSLIDDVYIPFLMRVGISSRSRSRQSITVLTQANEILSERFGPDIVYPEDRVLLQPADADSWNDIRRNVLFRTRIAAVGQANAEAILDDTDEIARAIAAELGRSL